MQKSDSKIELGFVAYLSYFELFLFRRKIPYTMTIWTLWKLWSKKGSFGVHFVMVICLIPWPFEPYGHNPTNRKLQKFSVYKLTWQLPSFITNRSSFITNLDFCESCFWPWHCCHLIYRLIKQIQKLKYKLKSLKNKLLEYKSTL